MRVCGVDLKGNDAIICIITLEHGLYDIPRVRVSKLTVQDPSDAEQMKKFQFAFAKLMTDYKVDKVAIKGRAMKGKFAGGAIGFKLEAVIQLLDNVTVDIVSATFIKDSLKKAQVFIDFRDTELKKFQEFAFETAFAYIAK